MNADALATLLRTIAQKWAVPGAQLSLIKEDQTLLATHGVANARTQSPVTLHTRFQLGSTTKAMLSFIAHQLAQEAIIDLSAPISRILADTLLCANGGDAEISCLQLMSHQSGLCGDAFFDLGDDRGAERRLLETARNLPIIHAPGEDVSYCNFGYVLLGQILEIASGQHWTVLFEQRLRDALATLTLDPWPDHATSADMAIGHSGDHPVSRAALAVSNAAAGTTLIGTALDLSQFGRMVLTSLRGDGPLNQEAATAMMTLTRMLAPNERGLGFGAGLMVFQSDPLVIGHDGLTIGQQAYLRIFPERGVALAFLGNGGDMRSASAELFDQLSAVTGAPIKPPTYSATAIGDVTPGTYRRPNASIDITSGPARTRVTLINHEDWAKDLYGAREGPFDLVALKAGGYGFFKPGSATPYRLHIDGDAAYLGMRRYNRAETSA
ncbi:MAG: serine hydrolase domain-containing protein [Pseudomonadota bacterium]